MSGENDVGDASLPAKGGETCAKLNPWRPSETTGEHVVSGMRDDAFLSGEHVFGPVTSLYRFAEHEEAIARANAAPFGLSTGIFTPSLPAATRSQDEAQAGLFHVDSVDP